MNKHGQSIIEYVLIAVLVVTGIVVMGPYVLRSVGAHFKLWDEGVRDSFSENLRQAPINAVNVNIPLNCNCQNTPGDCGAYQAGVQCGAGQRIVNHTCSIIDCDGQPESSCVLDNTCCSAWAVQGCGTVPIPAADTDASNNANNIPAGTPPPTSNNCYYGQQIEAHICGTDTSIQCVPSASSTCFPQCTGTIPQGAQLCPNATTYLGQSYQYAQVGDQTACSTTGGKCQYYLQCGYPYCVCTPSSGCTTVNQASDYTSLNINLSAGATVYDGVCASYCTMNTCWGSSQDYGTYYGSFSNIFETTCKNNSILGFCQQPNYIVGMDGGYDCAPPAGTTTTGIYCNWSGAWSLSGQQGASFAAFCTNHQITGFCSSACTPGCTQFNACTGTGCNWEGFEGFVDYANGNDFGVTCHDGYIQGFTMINPAAACF